MFNTSIDVVITDHMIQTSQGFFNVYAELKDNSIVVSQNTWQFYSSNNIVDYRVCLRLVKSIFWLDVHRHATDKANLMTFPEGILILDRLIVKFYKIMRAIEKSVHVENYAQSSSSLFKFNMAPKSYTILVKLLKMITAWSDKAKVKAHMSQRPKQLVRAYPGFLSMRHA